MATMKEYYKNRVVVAEFIAEAAKNAVKTGLRNNSKLTADLCAPDMQFLADVVKCVEGDVE